MKKTMKKALAIVTCGALLVGGSVMGTLAWFTAQAKPVNNTFKQGEASGNIAIILDEAEVDEYGVAASPAARVDNNEYKLVPNHFYVKDPTVTVEKKSEPCFVYVKLTNGLGDQEMANDGKYLVAGEENTYTNIAAQMAGHGWTLVDGYTDVYFYKDVVSATENDVKLPVFDNFVVKQEAVADDLDAVAPIIIDAYAVQADGFVSTKGVAADAKAALAKVGAPAGWTAAVAG